MGQEFFLISNTRGRNETSAKHTVNVKMSYLGCGRVTHFFCRGKQQTQSVVLGEYPATPLHTRARGLPITGIINEPSWSVSPDHIAKLYCTSQKQHRLEPFQIAPSFTLSLFFPGSALAGRQAGKGACVTLAHTRG